MHRLEDREEMVLVKVSKITKVRKGNRTFYVLEKEDLPDIKGSQEEYLEADKQLKQYGKIVCDDTLLPLSEDKLVQSVLESTEEEFQRYIKILSIFLELEAQMLWNPWKRIFIRHQLNQIQEMSEYAGGKKCILNYLDRLLTMTRLTKWEEDWLLTLKNALTAI